MTLILDEPAVELARKDRMTQYLRRLNRLDHPGRRRQAHLRNSRLAEQEDEKHFFVPRPALIARDLDREVRLTGDPALYDPYWAMLFPIDEAEWAQIQAAYAESLSWYEEEMLREFYRTSGWGPGPAAESDYPDEPSDWVDDEEPVRRPEYSVA